MSKRWSKSEMRLMLLDRIVAGWEHRDGVELVWVDQDGENEEGTVLEMKHVAPSFDFTPKHFRRVELDNLMTVNEHGETPLKVGGLYLLKGGLPDSESFSFEYVGD